jgi:hypothetical protein
MGQFASPFSCWLVKAIRLHEHISVEFSHRTFLTIARGLLLSPGFGNVFAVGRLAQW